MHQERIECFSPLGLAVLLVALSPVVAGAFPNFGYVHNAWLQVGMPALAAWAIWPSSARPCALPLPLAAFGLLAIWGSALASTAWATNSFLAWMTTLHWQTVLICFVLVYSQIRKERDARYLLRMLVLSLAYVALLGIAQAFFKVNWVPQVTPAASSFGSKNMAAQFVVLLWPLVVGLLVIARTRLERWALAIVLVVSWTYLLQTMARAALLASFIMIAAWCAVAARYRPAGAAKRVKGPIALLGGILLVAASLGGLSVDERGQNLYETISQKFTVTAGQTFIEKSAAGRIPVFANTLSMIADNLPVGVGAGNWQVHYPAYQNAWLRDYTHGEINASARNTHNDLLQLAAEYGLLGLVGLGLIAISLVHSVRRIHEQAFGIATMQVAAAIGLLGLLIGMQFTFPLQRTITSCAAACLLAVLLWPMRPRREIMIPRGIAMLGSALLTLSAVALAAYHIRGYEAWGHNRAADSLARGRHSQPALERIDQAIELEPNNLGHLLVKMQVLDQLKDWRNLAAVTETLVDVYPYRRSVLLGATKAHLMLDQPEGALPYAAQLAAIAPLGFSGNETLGTVYSHLGDYDKACTYYKRALANRTYPGARSHAFRGRALERYCKP